MANYRDLKYKFRGDNITNIPAANITGTLPANTLGNVDTSSIRNTIGTLALHSAISDNKAAHSMANQFTDVFEDATGVDTTSTAGRSTSEYMASIIVSDTTYGYDDGITIGYSIDGNGGITAANCESGGVSNHCSTGHNYGQNQVHDFQSDVQLTGVNVYWQSRGGYITSWNLTYSTDNSNWTNLTGATATGICSGTGPGFTMGTTGWGGCTFPATPANGARYWRITHVGGAGDGDWGTGEIQWPGKLATVNASGNYTCTNQTAPSAVTKMGIVIAYTNNEGTATLDTDLVAEVSANGGTNWSNAPLTDGGNFASTIKIAKANGIAVTSGTAPKYRISFANQSSGSKETRVEGVSLLY